MTAKGGYGVHRARGGMSAHWVQAMASMPHDGWAAGARCVRIAIDAPKLITICEPTNGNHAYAHAMECHARAALFGDEQAACRGSRGMAARNAHGARKTMGEGCATNDDHCAENQFAACSLWNCAPMNDLAASTSTAVPHLIDRRVMLQVHNHSEVPDLSTHLETAGRLEDYPTQARRP